MTAEDSVTHLYEVCPLTGCWVWKVLSASGYPAKIWVKDPGRHLVPQRVVWNQRFSDNQLLRQHILRRKCNTFACVNPDHYRVTTVRPKAARKATGYKRTPTGLVRQRTPLPVSPLDRLALYSLWAPSLAPLERETEVEDRG